MTAENPLVLMIALITNRRRFNEAAADDRGKRVGRVRRGRRPTPLQ